MAEKPEVLDAVLKETVDLVMDLGCKMECFVGFLAWVSVPFCF